jgi:GTP diphosphokinase / guanosine-3',5'-bis(diphosphate) 3'-diphosphatase
MRPEVSFENLLNNLPVEYSGADREMITHAYEFAKQAHEGQKRASGQPYITHCVAVANILSELNVPPAIIIAGLLHDTVEDTGVTLEDLAAEFDEDVAILVDGVTKLSNLPQVTRDDLHQQDAEEDDSEQLEFNTPPEDDEVYADKGLRSSRADLKKETLRKTLMAMGDDVRIVLIKLADRLHNMRTLGHVPEHKQKRIAQETLDIFAPLANRLGIWRIKWELEDLSFRYVQPEDFKKIAGKLSEQQIGREEEVDNIVARLKTVMQESQIEAEITGRPKHIYSIYRKMIEKDEPFEMVRDLRAVRLIVKDIPTCYMALGVIHTHWRPIPREFDDYIAAPKDNFYRSLHTAVFYDDSKPLEVQIRTLEMHRDAEYGIAAHWRYKEKGQRNELYEQRINYFRKLMDWRRDVEDAEEFVNGMKSDVFEDRVYAFTPQGDIIDLPAGSTPIDFAYHVHTEIGNRCRGAKINSKLVSLDYILKTGDMVEILTAKQGGPSRDWLNTNLGLVNTQRARSKIRQWFKKQDRELNITTGKSALEKELSRLDMRDVNLDKLARRFELRAAENLFAAVGCGDISIKRIINKLSDLEEESQPSISDIVTTASTQHDKNAVSVLGLKGLLTNFARCCNPLPGDEIVGYITRGRGATIHRRDCPNILRMIDKDRERIVKVTWGEPQKTFPVSMEIKAYDRQGLMWDVYNILNTEGINITANNQKVAHNIVTINMTLEVRDISQLSMILTRIENLPNVLDAHRLKPG